MSGGERWDYWRWSTPGPKKPPPAHGIRMKKSGTTWWGRRWVEALERMSGTSSGRMVRGRTYARTGRTHDLVVKAGKVTARVTGSRATPYKVRITLGRLPDRVWDKAIAAMAAQARFSAALLAGQMPQEIDAAFQAADASVFPSKQSDLQTECSCPDWANPCKHVAAIHYVLGEALDRDPFLLFELRGRTKDQVLDALRAARAGDRNAAPAAARQRTRAAVRSEPRGTRAVRDKAGARGAGKPGRSADRLPGISLPKLPAAAYERPPAPLPSLRLTFAEPPASGAMLRQLGTPAGWSAAATPDELFGPWIRAAAERARGLALAEPAPAPGEIEEGGTQGGAARRKAAREPAGEAIKKTVRKTRRQRPVR